MRRFLTAVLCVALAGGSLLRSADIWVDQNFGGTPDGTVNRPWNTIQEGVDDAVSGDRIFVRAGTYAENILIDGLSVELLSVEGAVLTTIDGGGLASVLRLDDAGASVVDGFRVTGGMAEIGAGIQVIGGMPIITRCVIEGNDAVLGGGGGGFGGGIDAFFAPYTVITDNLIRSNTAAQSGGGISLFSSNFSVVSFNTVVGNTAGTFGSGIHVENGGAQDVANNIVAYNGGGIASGGLEVSNAGADILGNLLYQNTPADFVSTQGALPAGNPIADPRFLDAGAGDHHILLDSPAVDDVDATVPPSATDLEGNPRPVDADLSGVSTADKGCYEHLGQIASLDVDASSLVTWSAAFTTPDQYHIYRGTPLGLMSGGAGACQDHRDPDPTDTEFLETADPAVGELWTYLVTFELREANASPGLSSAGVDRVPGNPCP